MKEYAVVSCANRTVPVRVCKNRKIAYRVCEEMNAAEKTANRYCVLPVDPAPLMGGATVDGAEATTEN